MDSSVDDPLGIVGTTVDKYRIVGLAGEGGFSVVYQAEHPIWKQPVAIKFFTILEHAEPALREHLLEDFIQEGKLMSSLSGRSAAIVQARDIGKFERPGGRWIPYMVLEWLDGRSLEAVLQDERKAELPSRTLEQAVRLLGPAAHALRVAHKHNVAHRDLKPANLVVLGDAREPGALIKVLDFGIAKIMGEHDELNEQLRRTGQQLTAFTPTYGAPEQFSRSHGATGPWTDVHAMALILLEVMRGGEPVLHGESLYEIGRIELRSRSPAHSSRARPRRVRRRRGSVRQGGRAQGRGWYPSMSELWDELERACGIITAPISSGAERPSPKTEPGAPPQLEAGRESLAFHPTVKAGNVTVAAVATSLAPAGRTSKLPLWLGGAALAALLTGWLVSRGPTSERGPSNTIERDSAAAAADVQAAADELTATALRPAAGAASGGATASTQVGADAGVPDAAAAPPVAGSRSGAATNRPPGSPAGRTTAATAGAGGPSTTGNAWDPATFGGRR